jgi:glutathione synthase/RimK-type ligase-like ATP-grasp enzyme
MVQIARIGILRGMETTFPDALIANINKVATGKKLKVAAEFIMLGGTKMAEPSGYQVIIDRISHEVAYYRAYLKNAVLTGTDVINNPFWWSADDKFFNYSLADKMGIPVPKTVILPHHQHPPNTTSESFRNLIFPLPWDQLFEYVGFPAFLKPFDGGGWRHVYKVTTADDFFAKYNETCDLCMVLQENIEFQEYYRCYCIDKKHVRIMQYDPGAEPANRYVKNPTALDAKITKQIEKYCTELCKALGYDFNTLEFAVRDGIPYAIDYMNPAPDCDYYSVTPPNFEWVVDKVTEMAIDRALNHRPYSGELRWSQFLNGPQHDSQKVRSTTKKNR